MRSLQSRLDAAEVKARLSARVCGLKGWMECRGFMFSGLKIFGDSRVVGNQGLGFILGAG